MDPRVIRTRQMLRDALVTLVLRKGYDAITIQDITEQAGLRRATFYLHYRDKEELLTSLMRETVDHLTQKMDALEAGPLTAEMQYVMERLTFEHVRERANLYRALLKGQSAVAVTGDLRAYMAARIREQCLAASFGAAAPIPVDVIAHFMAAAKLNMVIWWLENDMPYSPEDMAAMSTRLMLDGVGRLLTPRLGAALAAT